MEILLNLVNVSWIFSSVRKIFLLLDAVAYSILEGAINIFFMVGNFNMGALTDKILFVIDNLKSLVGIYILFKLSILFLNYLIEPEKFKDKSAGGAKLVKDIVIVIVLLVLLNGNVLFGIFNDIQKVVFSNGEGEFEVLDTFGLKPSKSDIIQNMILGDVDKDNIPHSLAVNIMGSFLYMYDKSDEEKKPTKTSWYDCGAGNNVNDPEQVMGKIANEMPYGMSFFYLVAAGGAMSEGNGVQYTSVISTIFGVYMIIKFFKYGLQLVLRFLKLFLMQILAPIAIVSYITPEGKKTFNNFWKTYFTIYMELFIRLLVVYISVYMMSVIVTNIDTISDGKYDAITSLILMIMLMLGVNKFMDEMPNIISNLFGGGKLEDKQKSMGAILGGVLGGGIGLATGLGAARAAGAKGLGAALGGVTGMFGGVKSGANSQNLGAFVSGQVSNATKATGRGMDIYNAGSGGGYLQMQTDKIFGGANKLKAEAATLKSNADHHTQSATNAKNLKSATDARLLKEVYGVDGDKASWVNSKTDAAYAKIFEDYEKTGSLAGVKVKDYGADGKAKVDSSGSFIYKNATSIEDVRLDRERYRNEVGESFDKEANAFLANQMTNPNQMHASLRHAYEKYTADEINHKKTDKDYTPRIIQAVTNPDGTKGTNLKAMKDGHEDSAHRYMTDYNDKISSQRYQNIGK